MILTLKGQTKDVRTWSGEVGLSISTIFSRKARGWSDEKTLTQPLLRNETKITKNDCELFINDLSRDELLKTKHLAGLAPARIMKPGQYIRRYHAKKFDKYFDEVYKPMKQNEKRY